MWCSLAWLAYCGMVWFSLALHANCGVVRRGVAFIDVALGVVAKRNDAKRDLACRRVALCSLILCSIQFFLNGVAFCLLIHMSQKARHSMLFCDVAERDALCGVA